MAKPKIQIILGSTRENRRGIHVANLALAAAREREDMEAELLDLRDWPLPFYNEPKPADELEGKYSTPEAQKWVEKIDEADGYLIVTPEYNHGYPAVLKNALDFAYNEWNGKPVAFISYGGAAGGARSVEQLRQVVLHLQLIPLAKAVHISKISSAVDENGNFKDSKLKGRINSLLEELIEWINLLKPRAHSLP